MTDHADYTGKVRTKGVATTGITEGILRRLHSAKGGRLMCVVELKAEEVHDKTDGTSHRVDFTIEQIEPAPTEVTAEHLRELTRSFHYERKLAEDGPDLFDQSIEPKVADVLARGAAHEPHPFIPTNVGADGDTVICDVCQLLEDGAPHRAYDAQHADPTPTPEAEGDEPTGDQLPTGPEWGDEPPDLEEPTVPDPTPTKSRRGRKAST